MRCSTCRGVLTITSMGPVCIRVGCPGHFPTSAGWTDVLVADPRRQGYGCSWLEKSGARRCAKHRRTPNDQERDWLPMTASNEPNRGRRDTPTTVELLPWERAEIRRQLYVDLRGLAEHIAEEANSASQMGTDSPAQQVIGEDLRAFCHRTFGDAVALLDRIGWDVNGDTALLIEHGKAVS